MATIAYIRVSTAAQANDGYGLDVQEQAVRSWARARGRRIRTVYRDEGVSGSTIDRPGLTDLLADVEDGDTVVVPRLDRLARDVVYQELILRDLWGRGAVVVSCSEAETGYLSDDDGDPARELIRTVLGAVSAYERKMIALRLKAGRRRKAALGGYAGGRPAFGVRAEDRELVVDEHEREAIDLAVSMRRSGSSLRAIAVALTEAGYQPKRSTTWHPYVVSTILAREGVEAA